jgi:hypothetical protein
MLAVAMTERLGEQALVVAAGQLRRQVRLGSQATYRVCAINGAQVEVEVVRAPGLAAGQRFTFTRDAVLAMELVTADEQPA